MKLIFHGKVQGVGFRYYSYKTAMRYNIAGTVRNCSDGTVEMIVDDDDQNYDEFIKKIKEGNGFMKIEKIERVNNIQPNRDDFQIVY